MSVVLHGGPPQLDGERWPAPDTICLGTVFTAASYIDGYVGELVYRVGQEPNAVTSDWHASYDGCRPFAEIAEERNR